MADDALTATGLAVLLVYGAKINPPRNGAPGIRVTAGHQDGTVLLEAVGYLTDRDALTAIARAAQACIDADLNVSFAPTALSKYPARVISRKVVRT